MFLHSLYAHCKVGPKLLIVFVMGKIEVWDELKIAS